MTKDSNILIDTCTFSHLFGERLWNNNSSATFKNESFNEKLKKFKNSFFKVKPNCYITDMTYIEMITGFDKKYFKEINSVLKEFKFNIACSNTNIIKYVPSIFNDLNLIEFNEDDLSKIRKIKYETTSSFFTLIVQYAIDMILTTLMNSKLGVISETCSNFYPKFQQSWNDSKGQIEKILSIFLEENYNKKICLLKDIVIPYIENIFVGEENDKYIIGYLQWLKEDDLYKIIYNKFLKASRLKLNDDADMEKCVKFVKICSSFSKENENVVADAAFYILGNLFYKSKFLDFNDLVDAYNFFVREYENINKVKLEYFTIDMKWYKFKELLKIQEIY